MRMQFCVTLDKMRLANQSAQCWQPREAEDITGMGEKFNSRFTEPFEPHKGRQGVALNGSHTNEAD